MSYVDGFVTPVPQDRLEDYRKQADLAARIWREHGALEVVERVADDVASGEVTSFPRRVQARNGATVVLSWIRYEGFAAGDRAFAGAAGRVCINGRWGMLLGTLVHGDRPVQDVCRRPVGRVIATCGEARAYRGGPRLSGGRCGRLHQRPNRWCRRCPGPILRLHLMHGHVFP